MPKCPHCGEPVDAGQETCFACSQKVRIRRRRNPRPANPVIFIIPGLAILVAAVALIITASTAGKKNAALARQRQLERVQDSVRRANRAHTDTAKTLNQKVDDARRLQQDLDKQEARLNGVRQDVVKDQPTADQSRLIAQARSELSRLRQLAATMALATKQTDQDKIRTDVRNGQRRLRDLISELARAPKAKASPPAGSNRATSPTKGGPVQPTGR
jgi:hypothetical protein